MNIIQIEVFKDRKVYIEDLNAGNSGESGATNLKFVVPKEYAGFYKYLDIITSDGERTQTIAGDRENNIFYYELPYILTGNNDITLQLVMKNENKIFKSNMFVLTFNQSIDGTQYLENNFQDTIEFLMENKTEKRETQELLAKVNQKLNSEEFYRYKVLSMEDILKKANESEVNEKILNLIDTLSKKVDKESGKKLSSNDFTDFEKNKLSELPDAKELFEVLNSKISLIYTDAQDENFSYDNFINSGIYFIVVNDGDVSLVHTLKVCWDFDTLYQELDNSLRRNFEYDEWTRWETFNVDFTPDEKKEVAKIKDIEEEVNNLIPEIDSLWNYVNTHDSDISYLMEQIGSIDSALDNIIEIQNSLIGGDL